MIDFTDTYDVDVADFDQNSEMEDVEQSLHTSLGILDLPEEIMTEIFRFLDPRSFCRAAGVCKFWRKLAASPWLWWMRCNVIWEQMHLISRGNARICEEILSGQVLVIKYSTRVRFLLETLSDLNERTTFRIKNNTKAHYNVNCYYYLSSVILGQLFETRSIIERIMMDPNSITVNFDILDLSIRRYFNQLDYMFPVAVDLDDSASNPDSCFVRPISVENLPSSIIKDESARIIWDKCVGPEVHAVNFDWFFEHVLICNFPRFANDVIFRDYFKFFVNFPRDDLMTTYKWAVIIDQFGPFDEFPENFQKYACGNGFLGLINSVEAENHLSSPNTFLLRFSRKEPEKLTFSYKITTGACRHRRKPCGIPINQFIYQNFNPRRFIPVEKRLEEYATQIDSIEKYCESTGYFIS